VERVSLLARLERGVPFVHGNRRVACVVRGPSLRRGGRFGCRVSGWFVSLFCVGLRWWSDSAGIPRKALPRLVGAGWMDRANGSGRAHVDEGIRANGVKV